ncbi:MAG: hypothetical protein ACP5J4_11135 [Anaerolineae bacterium]
MSDTIVTHFDVPSQERVPQKAVDLNDDTFALAVVVEGIDGIAIPTGAPVVGQAVIAVTGTAVALAAVATPLPTSSVLVAALSTNGAMMTVGGAGVTNTVDGSGNGFILEAGQSVVIMTDDLADVYVNGTANDIATFSAG